MDISLINKAIAYAAEKHNGVFRKGTEMPYILHPLEAGVIAASMTNDSETVAGAILHDTIEDTDATKEEIAEIFNENIAFLVCNESEDKRENMPKSETWKIRKQETIDHLKNCGDERILIIALADKLSNVRAIHRDYEVIGSKIWDRFNQKDPELHKWYYSSFLDTCRCLENTDAYKEYALRIDAVFGK